MNGFTFAHYIATAAREFSKELLNEPQYETTQSVLDWLEQVTLVEADEDNYLDYVTWCFSAGTNNISYHRWLALMISLFSRPYEVLNEPVIPNGI